MFSNPEAVTVTLHEPAERPAASASAASPIPAIALPTPAAGRPANPLAALRAFVVKTLNIAEWEARKLAHDPTDLITRSVQPLLWLLVFGQVLARTRAIGTGSTPYQDFLSPGILAQSVLFLSIFYGIAVIWERDLGVIHK